MATVTRFYSNVAISGTIGNPGGLSNAATSMYLTTTPSGYPGSFPFTLRLQPATTNEELVNVVSGSGTVASPWVIQRGYDGTTAVSHAQGSVVAHGLSAYDVATSRTHESLDNTTGLQPHGLPLTAWQSAAFAVINETLLGATATIVTWNSIPQTYTHLLVIVQGRNSSTSAQFVDCSATVNGDTSALYSYGETTVGTTTGTLKGPTAAVANSQAGWPKFILMAGSQAGTAVNAGGGWAIIPNYAGTTLNKMFVSLSGYGDGTDSALEYRERFGWYNPTSQAGISTLSLAASVGSFNAGSFFGLYGLS